MTPTETSLLPVEERHTLRAPATARVQLQIPARAVYKPASKWTTAAAIFASIALHALAVVYIGPEQEEPAIDAGFAAEDATEVTGETMPIASEPPPVYDEPIPLELLPPPPAPPEFAEEKATPAPQRSDRRRAAAPIPRATSGTIGGTSSISTAKTVAISAPRPAYPYEARRARVTGSGVAIMTVDRSTGYVTSAVMAQSTGSPILDNAATSAFRRWRFQPGTVSRVRVPITFTMAGAEF